MMLTDGITCQGETCRTMDKMGKIVWTATPKRDMSLKDKTLPAGRDACCSNGVDSSVRRSSNGTK